jgi:hypothetical protein
MNMQKINDIAEQAGICFWGDEEWGPGKGIVDTASIDAETFYKFAELLIYATKNTRVSTGHCENHKQPGGCKMHKSFCGYPRCDEKSVI